MKIALFVILVLFTLNLFAQQDSTSFKTRYGIGVTFGQDISRELGYSEIYYYPLSFGNIYFPIDMSPKLRIEPEIGYYLSKYKENGYKSTFYNLRFGIGIFAVKTYDKSKILIGGRAGMIYGEYENSYSGIDSKNDYYFGFASGGEYSFSSHISIGGEVQLNYIIPDDYNNNDDISQSLISTRALVVLRFYY